MYHHSLKSSQGSVLVKCRDCQNYVEVPNTEQMYRCSRCMEEIRVQSRHDQSDQRYPENKYYSKEDQQHSYYVDQDQLHQQQQQSRRNSLWLNKHRSSYSTSSDYQQQNCRSWNFNSQASHFAAFKNKDASSNIAWPLSNSRLLGKFDQAGKRALICGVSYKKKKYKILGSLVDVYKIKELLIKHYDFPPNAVRVLTEENDRRLWPTKQNIEDGLRWLVKDCKAGDSLVFYFSGHGLRQPEFNGDERDGFDETICPLDFKTHGMIIDNDLNSIIVKPLVEGVVLHAIIDACHSGTILDLPWLYDETRSAWVDNSPPVYTFKGTSGGLAISLSACEDNQMAADTTAFKRGEMCGAMTHCFIRAIERNPQSTYLELITEMYDTITEAYASRCRLSKLMDKLLKRNFYQLPQLCSSEKFDVRNTRFML